jgi:SchA/CurD like domain
VSQFFALMWTVKPGTEDQVREIFSNYGRPDPIVKDEQGNVTGRLLGTQVFLKGNTVVRVMEVEGSLPAISAHLGRQAQIREVEAKLDPLIEIERDMSNPQGAAKFFMDTSMECLVARKLDDDAG